MKKLLILLSILVFVACGSGGSSAPPVPTTTAPKITKVLFYNETDLTTPTTSFETGDYVYIFIYATDPDLDMTTLYETHYYPSDSTTIHTGPISSSLPSQSASEVVYYNLYIMGSAGSWRTEFQIEDAKGNDSNIFKVYISIS